MDSLGSFAEYFLQTVFWESRPLTQSCPSIGIFEFQGLFAPLFEANPNRISFSVAYKCVIWIFIRKISPARLLFKVESTHLMSWIDSICQMSRFKLPREWMTFSEWICILRRFRAFSPLEISVFAIIKITQDLFIWNGNRPKIAPKRAKILPIGYFWVWKTCTL